MYYYNIKMNACDIINNKYIIITQVGSGNFCDVWLGLDFKKSKYVAVKIFNDENMNSGYNEIDVLQKIKKHNYQYCISFIEYFEYKQHLFIIQELMVGSLYSIIKTQFPNGLPIEIVKKISFQLIQALNFIHNTLKIIHADFKPENILLVGHSIAVDNIIKRIKLNQHKNETIKNLAIRIKSILIEIAKEQISDLDIYESENSTEYTNNSDSSVSECSINTDSDISSTHDSVITRSCLDSDMENDFENKIIKVVSDEYLKNPRIVLADFGNYKELTDDLKNYSDFQTRHYRAPEIILRLETNEKTDIWAFGCSIYELVTGHILFDPRKKYNSTCDLQHLHAIQNITGLFPDYFYQSRKNNVFFRNNILLQKMQPLKSEYLISLLRKYTHLNEIEIEKINQFILLLLTNDYNQRPSAKQILKLDWFK
jgi:serine/threonine-protein kinase SRPK3